MWCMKLTSIAAGGTAIAYQLARLAEEGLVALYWLQTGVAPLQAM